MKVTSMFRLPLKTIHNGTVSQWELLKPSDFCSTINVLHANVVAPGVEVEPHSHGNDEQIYIILGGTGIAIVGDEEQSVGEGDTVYLPPKLPHAIKNTGTYPLRFLAIGAKVA
jgi:mannose-6-phosphate isomerase-like protein (cupin superfamily)